MDVLNWRWYQSTPALHGPIVLSPPGAFAFQVCRKPTVVPLASEQMSFRALQAKEQSSASLSIVTSVGASMGNLALPAGHEVGMPPYYPTLTSGAVFLRASIAAPYSTHI